MSVEYLTFTVHPCKLPIEGYDLSFPPEISPALSNLKIKPDSNSHGLLVTYITAEFGSLKIPIPEATAEILKQLAMENGISLKQQIANILNSYSS